MAKKKAKPAATKKTVKKTTTKKSDAPQRDAGVNKSQAIRDYAAKHPGAGPTEVSRELAKQGVQVSQPLVSNVLGAQKKRAKKRGPGRKPSGRPAASDRVSVSELVSAGQFVERVGGVENARSLIAAVEKLG